MKVIVACICLFIPFIALSEEMPLADKELPRADLLQSKIDTMMQDTASWLDASGDSDRASANGYLQLSWLPRTADLAEVDVNFKVSLNLPQWNDRFSLIIDNDDEDERLLDYESNYLDNDQEQDGINVAFQYIKRFGQDRQVKNRVGISRSQLYLRSEMQFNWQVQQVDLSFQPRVDYFLQDGWGPSVKAVAAYPLEKSHFSLSTSWQKIESESRSRQKVGLYL